jgi:hypothetical protein
MTTADVTLYHALQSRSTRAAWILFEFDEVSDFIDKEVSIKFLDFSKGEHKEEEVNLEKVFNFLVFKNQSSWSCTSFS